jgi:hypothetical protein
LVTRDRGLSPVLLHEFSRPIESAQRWNRRWRTHPRSPVPSVDVATRVYGNRDVDCKQPELLCLSRCWPGKLPDGDLDSLVHGPRLSSEAKDGGPSTTSIGGNTSSYSLSAGSSGVRLPWIPSATSWSRSCSPSEDPWTVGRARSPSGAGVARRCSSSWQLSSRSWASLVRVDGWFGERVHSSQCRRRRLRKTEAGGLR